MPRCYEHLPEAKTIQRAQNGDGRAVDYLISVYRPVVKSIAKNYFLPGGEFEDLMQYGFFGLYRAIRDYRASTGTPFPAFVRCCVRRRIQSALNEANTRQNEVWNNTALFMIDEGGQSSEDRLQGDMDTEEELLRRDDARRTAHAIEEALSATLTDFEWRVLHAAHIGTSGNQKDIAIECGCDAKSVNNALTRVRRKLTAIIAQND